VRRIILALMSTVTAVVLLFGYRTSTAHPATAAPAAVAAGSAGTGGSTGSSTSTTPAAPQSSSSSSSSPSASGTSSTKTVTGQTAQTRWGPVQVQITVSAGKVTAVNVLQVPSGNGRDVEINNQAVPVLKQETLQAQNANIDSVSGATVTSDGYITSLQSALNQAGL
jgi:uncharacterized protein with FMN-binding domain